MAKKRILLIFLMILIGMGLFCYYRMISHTPEKRGGTFVDRYEENVVMEAGV